MLRQLFAAHRIVTIFLLPAQPLSIRLVPVDELRNTFPIRMRRFVAQQLIGQLGIGVVALSVLNFQFERQLVTNLFGQRLDYGIVGRPDVQYSTVGCLRREQHDV